MRLLSISNGLCLWPSGTTMPNGKPHRFEAFGFEVAHVGESYLSEHIGALKADAALVRADVPCSPELIEVLAAHGWLSFLECRELPDLAACRDWACGATLVVHVRLAEAHRSKAKVAKTLAQQSGALVTVVCDAHEAVGYRRKRGQIVNQPHDGLPGHYSDYDGAHFEGFVVGWLESLRWHIGDPLCEGLRLARLTEACRQLGVDAGWSAVRRLASGNGRPAAVVYNRQAGQRRHTVC